MIDGQNFFHEPVRNDLITYDNMLKVATGQVDGWLYNWLFAGL